MCFDVCPLNVLWRVSFKCAFTCVLVLPLTSPFHTLILILWLCTRKLGQSLWWESLIWYSIVQHFLFTFQARILCWGLLLNIFHSFILFSRSRFWPERSSWNLKLYFEQDCLKSTEDVYTWMASRSKAIFRTRKIARKFSLPEVTALLFSRDSCLRCLLLIVWIYNI